jgi:hypothetical protein
MPFSALAFLSYAWRAAMISPLGDYTVVLHPAKAETGLQSWSNTKAQSYRHAWSVRCCTVAGRFT